MSHIKEHIKCSQYIGAKGSRYNGKYVNFACKGAHKLLSEADVVWGDIYITE